ncbi:unnamed protein product, partial [Lymnaea stagnalis]
ELFKVFTSSRPSHVTVHSVLWRFHDTLPLDMADDSYLRNTIVSASIEDTFLAHQDDTFQARQDDTLQAHQDDTLQAHQDDTIQVHQDDTLQARQDDTFGARQDDTLSPRQDDTLSARQDDTLSAHQDDTLLSRREDTLHARQLDTLHTCHAHVDYNGRRDHNIDRTLSDECSRGHSDTETRENPRELTPFALQDYINSITCPDDSLTNTNHVLEDFTSSGHPHGNLDDT